MAQHSPDDRAGHRPRYRGSDDDGDVPPEPLSPEQRRTRVLVIAVVVVVALLLAFVILHITGILGPGTNG